MERFTTKLKEPIDTVQGDMNYFSKDLTLVNAINKLGQLEDIEEKYGIDLVTLFEALKNGIWRKKFNKIWHIEPENLFIDNKMTFYRFDGEYFEAIANYNDKIFKWSLTKEELK